MNYRPCRIAANLLVILCCWLTIITPVFGEEIPLPEDAAILSATPDLPRNFAKFIGKWGDGKWNGQEPLEIIIENVTEDGSACIIYATSAYPSRGKKARYRRLFGRIDDEWLRTKAGRKSIHLQVSNSNDEVMNGIAGVMAFNKKVTLKRQPHPIWNRMSGDQIRKLFSGKTVEGWNNRRQYNFSRFYAPDGIVYEVNDFSTRKGRWHTDDQGHLCERFSEEEKQHRLCKIVAVKGEEYAAFRYPKKFFKRKKRKPPQPIKRISYQNFLEGDVLGLRNN